MLASLALRAIPWLVNLPLHHDEALYGTWGRAIADGSDPLLLIPWVDKPPLVLYLLGLSLKLFGTSEFSLRGPGMVAGVLTVWVTFGLGRRVAGERGAWLAALLVVLSPFAILFAPTAFTDGWLTLFLTAAAWAALAGRPGWAGLLLGLGCASKQQGVMAVPLVLALLVAANVGLECERLEREGAKVSEKREARRARSVRAALGVAAVAFVVVFGAVTYWDSLRWHNRPSYWDQSLQTYGGVILAPLVGWPERMGEWARQAGYWFGAWPVTALLLGGAILGAGLPGRAWFPRGYRRGLRTAIQKPAPRAPLILLAYLLGYLFVHVAFTFQPWDRYLLPILPLACILCGGGLIAGWDYLRLNTSGAARRWAALGASTALLYATTLGLTASIPVGSDIGAYRGVAEAARFLAEQPSGSTVYFDRLGWHLGYYLYDRPITRSWYDSPLKLANEAVRVASTNADASQWLLLPVWEEARLSSLQDALAEEGFEALPAHKVAAENGSIEMTLYRLECKVVRPATGANARDGVDVAKGQAGRAEGKP